jgi:tRNA/tmRNA/rRNA uracil-C5-methylase (TrmA/RlmC/RlmD family)
MTTMEIEITTMAHGGSGIGRVDGRVVFCPGVIPGEIVQAEITEDSKKSMWRAQAVSITKPSPHRAEHIWPEASIVRPWATRAGGADYGHIDLGHQRQLKTDILRDALRRFGRLDTDLVNQVSVQGIPGDDERMGLAWRTRVSLHADEKGALGPFAEKSHTVIPVTSLPLASHPLQESALLQTSFAGSTSVRALDSTGSGVRFVLDNQSPQAITEIVNGVSFALSDHSFWQVHQSAPDILGGAIKRALQQDAFDPHAPQLDLYSGVGLLAHALTSLSDTRLSLIAVESDEAAALFAHKNLESVADVSAIPARVDHWLRDQVSQATLAESSAFEHSSVILDPPRSGAKSDVIDALVALGVAQIIYVACDPVALGRDTALLSEAGYDMVFLEAWDMFPHTHHMETIATFLKR